MLRAAYSIAGKTFSSGILQGARSHLPPAAAVHVEANMEKLGIVLPAPGLPKANYNMFAWDGDLLYLSGHLPIDVDGTLITGTLASDEVIAATEVPYASGDQKLVSRDEGYEAARWCALNLISTLKGELGDLDRVDKIVKLLGIVQSTAEFQEHHLVMNGCSDTLMEVFGGDVGYHARSAIGTNSLPLDMAVEVEMIVRVKQ